MSHMEVDTSKPVEIAPGVFWVGVAEHPAGLQCNPYLIVDGDEGVILDPGSVLDFEYVLAQVERVLPLANLKYIVLSHQDPDLCSSVTLFEEAGFKGQIVTQWRAMLLQLYYGIKSPYYLLNENDFKLKLKSGRVINFIPTPYLHFPGASAAYDPLTKVLFPGDLFGAFSLNWSFYVEDKAMYLEAMSAFHEHYMPSNDVLRPVMEVFGALNIDVIASQHGSVIREDIRDYIVTLRDLECGTLMSPIKKQLSESGGYTSVCNDFLRRLCSVFPASEVVDVFAGTDIELDPRTCRIVDFSCTGSELWDLIFDTICVARGQRWLTVSEPFVDKLAREYDIPLPRVFASAAMAAELQLASLTEENLGLRELSERLDASLRDTEDKMTKCPITKLRNETFLVSYLSAALADFADKTDGLAVMCISIDRFDEISLSFGKDAIDETLRGVAYVLESVKTDTDLLFKLNRPSFAVVVPQVLSRKTIESIADALRAEIAASGIFIRPITVSVGVAALNEVSETFSDPVEAAAALVNLAGLRTGVAKSSGGNSVCATSGIDAFLAAVATILVVDPDPVNVDVLKVSFEALRYRVLVCSDGEAALRLVEQESPDLVISEAMLPKIDGFSLRDQMLASSAHKNVPFILVSYDKDADSVERAQLLGIEHYFKKPYLLSELVGTVKLKLAVAFR